MQEAITPALTAIGAFLARGGPAMWVIAGLSVLTLALILWKTWRLARLGAWAGASARRATSLWVAGDAAGAQAAAAAGRGMRAGVVHAAFAALSTPDLPEEKAREETARIARRSLTEARSGLRALELVATIAPLVGLLGTVLGMIEAFQALQEAGSRADPGTLAGGIWQALLTTAAGMAVAIPASAALTWFESVVDAVQADMEDLATQVFTRPRPSAAPPAGPPSAAAMTAAAG